MSLTRQSLALDVRPFVERNLMMAGMMSQALHQGNAKLHKRASREEIVRKLDTSIAQNSDVREQMALKGMLLARNLGSVVTVPLDFAFGTGRWQLFGNPSSSPYDFFTETLAHPCSLGVSGALLSATSALWSVFAATVAVMGCATWAAGKQLVSSFRGPNDPSYRLSWAERYKETEGLLLSGHHAGLELATAVPLSLFGARPVGTVPVIGGFARTHLVRSLPWIAPLTLFAPTMSMLLGRTLTAAAKFGISGIGYCIGYAAGMAYARTQRA